MTTDDNVVRQQCKKNAAVQSSKEAARQQQQQAQQQKEGHRACLWLCMHLDRTEPPAADDAALGRTRDDACMFRV
jgi:hypothetical protein